MLLSWIGLQKKDAEWNSTTASDVAFMCVQKSHESGISDVFPHNFTSMCPLWAGKENLGAVLQLFGKKVEASFVWVTVFKEFELLSFSFTIEYFINLLYMYREKFEYILDHKAFIPLIKSRVDVLTTFSDDHRNSRLIQRCK